jgi:serine/threonine-protein kinase
MPESTALETPIHSTEPVTAARTSAPQAQPSTQPSLSQPDAPAYRQIEQWSFALKDKSDSTETEIAPGSKNRSDTIFDDAPPTEEEEEEDFSFADDLQLVGKVLESKYEIESVLAEGGMAVLYLAKQKKMERTVVVKVVHNYLSHNQNEIQRFEREAQVVARLNHPNIVAVYDFGLIDGSLPFIVMEYIRGMNLSQKVSRHGPPGMAVAVRIIRQICRALEEAHSLGIIHRDLKPDNIILQEKFDRPDWVKIVDFGIAHRVDTQGKRLTRAGRMLGTPEYASPEQFKDVKLDPRSDIYSLGVVIFEMLTGHVPYEAGNLGALMAKILLDPVPSITSYRQDIAPDSPMDVLVRKCMEKDPDKRFQTVREVRKAADAAHHSE